MQLFQLFPELVPGMHFIEINLKSSSLHLLSMRICTWNILWRISTDLEFIIFMQSLSTIPADQ